MNKIPEIESQNAELLYIYKHIITIYTDVCDEYESCTSCKLYIIYWFHSPLQTQRED